MAQPKGKPIERVEVHPLVLLSVTDHFVRVAQDTKKRVVGALLGNRSGSTLNVTNSFAVPFDEDPKSNTWFLDYNYLEDMFAMFRRVNANEKIIGWYSTGPKLRHNDIDIHELFYSYTPEPIFVIIRVTQESEDIPIESYVSVDVVQANGQHEKEFANIESDVVASEAEAVGVEHLLREIQDMSVSTLTSEVKTKLIGLRGLHQRLDQIYQYLESVVQKQLPVNQEILQNLQLIFNYLPNLNKRALIESFHTINNDAAMQIYMNSLIRSVLALDALLENKLTNIYKEQKKEEEMMKELAKEKEEAKKKKAEAAKASNNTESSS